MRHPVWGLAMCLALLPPLYGQKRPTLGPSTPSLRGPASSQTANPDLLVKMRKVYIERMDDNLNEKLEGALAHVSWVKVVDKSDEADAIVRGTCFSLRRLKRLHAEVYISDRVTGESIWQDVVRVPYDPPGLPKAVDQAASEILLHLDQSIRTAAKR